MSEMVERVARALCVADGCDPDHESADPIDTGIKLWTRYVRDASAAIEAIREPTKAMIQAAYDSSLDDDERFDAHEIWQAMIDEALKPERR